MPQPVTTPPYDYIGDFTPDTTLPAVVEWWRHVEAGRIGTRAALAPDLLANLRATEALICRSRKAIW